ncbi:MAG: hypothetical protein IPJ49_20085 [Candidatus Obscuribacter sp.]|nr:hypothetical protein [Candidatus Obscuribacter sp.]
MTIDPKALQPLTLVDGEEVLDGRHKGETLTTRGPGKRINLMRQQKSQNQIELARQRPMVTAMLKWQGASAIG